MVVGHFWLLEFFYKDSVHNLWIRRFNCIRILKPDLNPDPKQWFGCYFSFALALIHVHVLVRHAVGASRMEGSLGVSLYLSRIQQEIIAEGGTQTSPCLRYRYRTI
jgi:hypothetical protein